jgi:hypothetical protein
VAKDWGEDIENAIKQMELIKGLHREETYDELNYGCIEVRAKKKFLDSLKIKVVELDIEKYVSLFYFP